MVDLTGENFLAPPYNSDTAIDSLQIWSERAFQSRHDIPLPLPLKNHFSASGSRTKTATLGVIGLCLVRP